MTAVKEREEGIKRKREGGISDCPSLLQDVRQVVLLGWGGGGGGGGLSRPNHSSGYGGDSSLAGFWFFTGSTDDDLLTHQLTTVDYPSHSNRISTVLIAGYLPTHTAALIHAQSVPQDDQRKATIM